MADTKTVEALTDALPRVGESEHVWCSVQGHDLRAAVAAIAALTARAEAAEARANALEKEARELLNIAVRYAPAGEITDHDAAWAQSVLQKHQAGAARWIEADARRAGAESPVTRSGTRPESPGSQEGTQPLGRAGVQQP